jgi:hypothetical protein
VPAFGHRFRDPGYQVENHPSEPITRGTRFRAIIDRIRFACHGMS